MQAKKVNRNLGQCSLRRKRRSGDPMAAFDDLPTPLRQWLSQAALPWSPSSTRRIWLKSRAKGLSPEDTLLSLSQAESKTLARDQQSILAHFNTKT